VLTDIQDVVEEKQADDMPVLTDIQDVVEEKQADDVPAPVRGQDVVLGAPVGDVRVAADARAVAAVDRGEEVRTLDAARDHFDVEQGGDARESSGGQEAPGGGDVDDDVPLLTDAVEEIEAAPAVEAEDWGEPSLFGEIDRDLQGAPEPPPYSAAVAADLPVLVAGSPAEPSPVASAAQGDSGDPVWVVAERLVEDSGLGPRHRASAAEVSVASEVALVESSAALDEIDAPLGPYRDSEQEAEEPPATAGEAAPVPAGGEPRDDAYWASLAEDVRMQVLQRIDIFTDTGLRQQLGERLKPVVDRASADLVSTVSQHVGELLRAYVAEAIEREIERWRSEGR
jgi:hypothetical protein